MRTSNKVGLILTAAAIIFMSFHHCAIACTCLAIVAGILAFAK